jgi:hypothetical protein
MSPVGSAQRACSPHFPGAGVRRYARPAVEALRGRGVAAWLLPAPGGAGGPADLERYGAELARCLASVWVPETPHMSRDLLILVE